MTDKSIYRIVFHNQGNVYELYAREISQSSMYAFVEIGDIIFGERSKLVVDPSDEKLKAEFSGYLSEFHLDAIFHFVLFIFDCFINLRLKLHWSLC